MSMLTQRADEILCRLPARPCVVAEVGVWCGELSELLLRRHSGLVLMMVDRWAAVDADSSYGQSGSSIAKMTQEQMGAAMAEAQCRTAFAGDRAVLLRNESVNMAYTFADADEAPPELDMVFIDGDHSYEGVTADLGAWLPAIKRHGWIGGHDYDHPVQGNVAGAVQDWRKEHGVTSRLELGRARTWFWRVR